MNIYYIWQEENSGYDTFSNAVVIADSVEEAQATHPYGTEQFDREGKDDSGTWADIDKVKVELIGIADESQIKGVVSSSFHAG